MKPLCDAPGAAVSHAQTRKPYDRPCLGSTQGDAEQVLHRRATCVDFDMKQQTVAVAADQNVQHEQYRRPTKRDAFLATMEQIVPWAELCSVIEPYYPKAGNGRPPVGLERMLRMSVVQPWFNLADAACEDALLDSTALRRFVGNTAAQPRPLRRLTHREPE